MNILLIAYYYNQPGCGGTERPRSLVCDLTAAGHRVTVLTTGAPADRSDGPIVAVADPSHNGDRHGWHYGHWLGRRLWVEGQLRLGRYASIYGSWQHRVERTSEEILERVAPQRILATYPTVENLALGMHFHLQTGAPLIADFRDGLLFEPVELRALGHRAARKAYACLEASIAAEAAAIVTVSPPISRYFQQRYQCRQVVTIANGFSPLPPLRPMAPSPFLPGHFHLVHTGSIALSDRGCDLAPLVRSLEKVITEAPDLASQLRLHFAGRLSSRELRLLRPLIRAGVVRQYGPLPRETALWMQRQAQLLLLLTSPHRSSVATGKLFEYMQTKIPVLALTSGTYAASIIRETGIGWTVSPTDSTAIAATLVKIVRGGLTLPRPDERAIARYDRQILNRDFLALLEKAGS